MRATPGETSLQHSTGWASKAMRAQEGPAGPPPPRRQGGGNGGHLQGPLAISQSQRPAARTQRRRKHRPLPPGLGSSPTSRDLPPRRPVTGPGNGSGPLAPRPPVCPIAPPWGVALEDLPQKLRGAGSGRPRACVGHAQGHGREDGLTRGTVRLRHKGTGGQGRGAVPSTGWHRGPRAPALWGAAQLARAVSPPAAPCVRSR